MLIRYFPLVCQSVDWPNTLKVAFAKFEREIRGAELKVFKYRFVLTGQLHMFTLLHNKQHRMTLQKNKKVFHKHWLSYGFKQE